MSFKLQVCRPGPANDVAIIVLSSDDTITAEIEIFVKNDSRIQCDFYDLIKLQERC